MGSACGVPRRAVHAIAVRPNLRFAELTALVYGFRK
jgi:hypothetical protein